MMHSGRLLHTGLLVLVVVLTVTVAGAVIAPGTFTVTPASLDFGHVAIGDTASLTVTVTNVSGSTVGPITMAGGAPGAPFNAVQNCQNATLDPGGTCQIIYSFSPTAGGSASATSEFTLNGEAYSVQLAGFGGTAAPVPTLSTWALVLFLGLIGMAGVVNLRRRTAAE